MSDVGLVFSVCRSSDVEAVKPKGRRDAAFVRTGSCVSPVPLFPPEQTENLSPCSSKAKEIEERNSGAGIQDAKAQLCGGFWGRMGGREHVLPQPASALLPPEHSIRPFA